jgi:hypothetical protein
MSVYDVWKAGELIRQGNVAEAMQYIAKARREVSNDNVRADDSTQAKG